MKQHVSWGLSFKGKEVQQKVGKKKMKAHYFLNVHRAWHETKICCG